MVPATLDRKMTAPDRVAVSEVTSPSALYWVAVAVPCALVSELTRSIKSRTKVVTARAVVSLVPSAMASTPTETSYAAIW